MSAVDRVGNPVIKLLQRAWHWFFSQVSRHWLHTYSFAIGNAAGKYLVFFADVDCTDFRIVEELVKDFLIDVHLLETKHGYLVYSTALLSRSMHNYYVELFTKRCRYWGLDINYLFDNSFLRVSPKYFDKTHAVVSRAPIYCWCSHVCDGLHLSFSHLRMLVKLGMPGGVFDLLVHRNKPVKLPVRYKFYRTRD